MPGRLGVLLCPFLLIMSSGYSRAATASRHSALHATRLTDIEYARVNRTSLLMDASIPAGAEKSPAVIIVHGGAWGLW
jgi:acetyl esterase/lipase